MNILKYWTLFVFPKRVVRLHNTPRVMDRIVPWLIRQIWLSCPSAGGGEVRPDRIEITGDSMGRAPAYA